MSPADVMGPRFARADAVALVIDITSPVADEAANAFASLGGGWRQGIEVWRGISRTMPFLVLIAASRRRKKLRAPYVFMARDLIGLTLAMRRACEMLDDVTCAWVRAVDGEALAIVDDMILADTKPEGRA